MMKKTAMCLSLMAMLVAGSSFAAGNVENGKVLAAGCAACHGADGTSVIPGYPSLSGQDAKYLVVALKAYKNGQRTNPEGMMMAPFAQALSEQNMEDLAAYYAAQ